MDLLDQMPQGSHWRAAQAADPRALEQLEEMDFTDEDFSPPLADWSHEMDVLAAMADWMQAAANRGNTDFTFHPYPRPRNPLGEHMEKKKREAEFKKAKKAQAGTLAKFGIRLE